MTAVPPTGTLNESSTDTTASEIVSSLADTLKDTSLAKYVFNNLYIICLI